MTELTIHYLAAILPLALAGLGMAIAIANSLKGMMEATERQPDATTLIQRTFGYGIFTIEAVFVISVLVSLMILISPPYQELTMPIAVAELAMALAIGLSTLASMLASGSAVCNGCLAVGRQPLFASKIQFLMVVIQTLIEAPAVVSLTIAIIIRMKIGAELSIGEATSLLGAGLFSGLSAVGPSIGQYIFSANCMDALAINRHQQSRITTYSLMTGLFIETPILLSFIVTIWMIGKPILLPYDEKLIILLGCSFCNFFATIGVCSSVAQIASIGVRKIALIPQSYLNVFNFSVISNVLIESSLFFPLVTVFLILTKTTH